ncbi:serine/threonine protein kinase [Thecaphora frezii]
MEPLQRGSLDKAHSTGTLPLRNTPPIDASTSLDAQSAPTPRTSATGLIATSARIRHGLLSRAGSEAEDRSYKGESPVTLTSDDEDSRISDSAALPRRFPSTSSSRVASIRSVSSRQTSGSWPIPHDLSRIADSQNSYRDPIASDGGSSLGRNKSVSSVSSVNSTSSLEAAPFREAPLGNVRVGFGGMPSHRSSARGPRFGFTQVTQPEAQQPANPAVDPPQRSREWDLSSGSATPSSVEPKGPSDRHKGVPKANNNAWLYRNAPGMRGSRLRSINYVEPGDIEEESVDPGQATPPKRARDALRLRIAKSASKLGLRTSVSQSPMPTPFGDGGGDASGVLPSQTVEAPSSDEDGLASLPAPRSPAGTRTPFFSTGPYSPHLLTPSGPSTFGSAQTERIAKTSTVTNAPMVVPKYAADLGRGGSAPEDGAPFQEVLEGLGRLPGPKVSPRSDLDGQALPDLFSKQMETPIAPLQRPPFLRADSSSNSQDMPAAPGLALAGSAADVSKASSLQPPARSSRRNSQISATSDGNPQQAPRAASKPSTRCPNDFHFGETLGEGSYSTVLEAWDLLSGPNPKLSGVPDPQATSAAAAMVGAGQKRGYSQIDLAGRKVYAVKVLDKVHILKQGKQKYVTVEKEALSRLIKFPGVVTLFWTFQDRESLYFVLELATNGELLTFIRKFGSFAPDCARFYAAMLADTIRAIHEAGVVHRDLKPENVLMDAKMRIKVTDFGSAKLLPPDGKDSNDAPANTAVSRNRAGSFVGTAEYVSPELLAETAQPASKPSDWWAFGCVVFQMVCGRPPFKGVNEYQTLQKVKNRDFAFPDNFPDDARDLVDRLLVLDPAQRPTGAEVLAHPYFASIDFSTLWEQPVPLLKTGITEPIHQVSHESSRSEVSFDESFVSKKFNVADEDVPSAENATSASGDESRRRRSNDADDSDLSDGSSDADSYNPVIAPQMPSVSRRRSSGFLRIMDGLTNKGTNSADQPSHRSPSGSGLNMLGSLAAPVPRRRISTMSVDTGSSNRRSRDQALEVDSRNSRESRSPLRSSAQLSPAPTAHPASGPGFLSWNALLLPHELMLYSCPVLQKKTGAGKIFSKRRQLILTNFPRLLCVKETPEVLKVKSEVILGLPSVTPVEDVPVQTHERTGSKAGCEPFPSLGSQADVGRAERSEAIALAGPNLLTAVEYKGGKAFTVRTMSKAFLYEVFSGDASLLVKGIRDASRCL